MIDLDGDGYSLVDLEHAVFFDLRNDGTPALVSWTRAGARDAFLCLDLDGNGRIDGGGELVGDAMLLANGKPGLSGFAVLAELDMPAMGGNGDKRISQADAIFDRLRLWLDANHNGISEREELLLLTGAGVVEIGLAYHFTARHDQYGNIFRYQGQAKLRNAQGHVRATPIYDVIFKKWDLAP